MNLGRPIPTIPTLTLTAASLHPVRPALLAFIGAGLLCVLSTCRAGPSGDGDGGLTGERMVRDRSDGVEFSATVRRRDNRLEVWYRIENKSGNVIAVLNRIPRVAIDGAPEYPPDEVYVDLDGGTLQLTKGALAVPEGVFLDAYSFPDASVVAAGTTVEETFVVPIPVKVRNPYRRRARNNGVLGEAIPATPAVARTVVLVVGIVPLGAGCIMTHNNPAFPDVVTLLWVNAVPGMQLGCQRLLSARFELDEELPVLAYKSLPWP